MSPVAFLVGHGGTLALGVSVVLALGLLAMAGQRQVAGRRRLGALTTLAVPAYLLAALLPWPRVEEAAALPSSAPPPARVAEAAVPDPAASPEERARHYLAVLESGLGALQPRLAAAESSPAAVPMPTPGVDWAIPVAWLWLAGVGVALLRLSWGGLRLWWLLRGAASPVGLPVPGLPPRVRVRVVRRAVRPFCVGVVRPVIVLPQDLTQPARRGQAVAVLRHEIAHLQHGDAALQAGFALLSVLLFWHPLFHLLRRQVRFASELLADDAAARGHGVHDYARDLIDLAERRHPEMLVVGAVSVFHRPSEFYRRIQMLLQREGSLAVSVPFHRRAAHGLAALALVATVATWCGAPLRAQDPVSVPPVAAGEAETLRTTIAELQAEIARMRALVDSLQPAAVVAPPPDAAVQPAAPAAPVPDLAPTTIPDGASSVALPMVMAEKAYEVRRGDSIERILRRHGLRDAGAVERLLRLNPGLEMGRLHVGQRILVPMAAAADPAPPAPALGRPGAPGLGVLPTPVDSVAETVPPGEPAPGLDVPMPAGGPTAAPADPAGVANATAELTARYLDLQAEVESLALDAEHLTTLAEAGHGEVRSARQATLRHRAAERKLRIVDRLIRGEIEATRAEIEALGKDATAGDAACLQRARARLESLESVY